jgi:predicted transcriptional regulator
MHKTTVYLPEDLKAGLTREARRRGSSEADVIRKAIADAIASPRPSRGFLDAEPIADRVDELLEGFGSG